MALVCLVENASLVDEHLASGVQVRRGQPGGPDLVFFSQEGGTSVAFIHMQTAAPGVLERVTHLGRTFKHAFVLMDNSTLDDAACQDASFRLGTAQSLAFVTMPMGAAFTQQALQLARVVLDAAGKGGSWRQQRLLTSESMARALAEQPLPSL